MLFRIFLDHQWKESTRSSIWQRNLATNIFIGLILLMMILNLLMIGILLDPGLRKAFPDDDPVMIFNGVIIYYLLFDLLLRYMMQGLPTFSIESYLHLPVKKKMIVHFVISKSVFHVLNFLPLLVFLPFALISVTHYYDRVQVLAWIFAIIFLILNNNFLATYFKRKLVSKPLITLAAGLVLISIAILDHFGLIELSGVSSIIFSSFLENPAIAAIPFFLALFSYVLNYFLLKNMMYPEEVIRRKSYEVQDIQKIKYLTSMGLTGDLVMIDLKLWLRHKRTRTILYFLPLFLLYGLFFYTDPEAMSYFVYVFVGTFMIGGLNMNYLSYAFSYESNHFDGILTSRIRMDLFIRAKLTIGTLVTTLCFILTIPYLFFGYHILLINLVAYLFSVGVISFLLLYMATFNKKRMDLSKGSAFNYQGLSTMNWIIPLLVYFLPMIIYALFNWIGNQYLALAVLGLMGITGFLARNLLIRIIVTNFNKRRYIMAEGFREGG